MGSKAKCTDPRRSINKIGKGDLRLYQDTDLQQYEQMKGLLEYYRCKAANMDKEQEDLVERLEKYRITADRSMELENELRKRAEEISQLNKALSDLQVCLFQERQQVLKLYSDNDILKILELEDRKKIDVLLSISGHTERELTFFLKNPSEATLVQQKKYKVPQKESSSPIISRKSSKEHHGYHDDCGSSTKTKTKPNINHLDSLSLKIDSLSKQLAEQQKLHKEQINSLSDDRRIAVHESEAEKSRHRTQLKAVECKLEQTNRLMYESTAEFLRIRKGYQQRENDWVVEKDNLDRKVKALYKRLEEFGISTVDLSVPRKVLDLHAGQPENFRCTAKTCKIEICGLKKKLEEKCQLIMILEEKCRELSGQLQHTSSSEITAKHDFKENVLKLSKQVDVMRQRYMRLEERRMLEAEGFRSQARGLQRKIHDLEKELTHFAASHTPRFGTTDGGDVNQELALLMEIQKANKMTNQTFGELRHTKAKIYLLENQLQNK